MTQPAKNTDNRPRLALVDGSGYIFRAYHALPPLTRKDGIAVGAVYGFTNMLMKLQDTLECDYLAVIFDAARLTFRNEIYEDYKANRPSPPEDLVPQFALVREATQALNLPAIEMENYEADDLIASYAKQAVSDGMDVVIVSSDKDLMQLLNDHVAMFDPMKNKPLGLEQVRDKFGVTPDKVIEVQALIGDSVDNVPGVPGIGPKTAAQLIEEFGDLESVLQNAESIKQNKRRESLIEFAEQARISRKLVELKDDIALPMPIKELDVKKPDMDELAAFLQENSFTSLLKRIGVTPQEVAAQSPTKETPKERSYTLVQTETDLQQWIDRATQAGKVAVDTETTSLNAMQAELVGISLSVTPHEACYIPLAHVSEQAKAASQSDLFGGEGNDESAQATEKVLAEGQIDKARALEMLRPILADPAVLKIGQNIKYDLLVLRQEDVEVSPVDDTMLLSYVSSAGLHNHNMDDLSERYLEHRPIAFKDVVGTGKNQKTFDQIPIEDARDYAAEDADITLQLHQMLKAQMLDKQLSTVYERIERPLIPVLVQMEEAGIKADPQALKGLSDTFAKQMAELESRIHALAGREFNVGSPKQLGEIMFDELELPGGKKSKTGAYSTGAEILEELAADGHELPEKVLTWRQLSKLKSTYADALINQINPRTKRVHTSFSMASTTTGRLSSSDPNLQNIPIRTEAGRKIREAFIAEDGHLLISADYSQIELRLLAHIADIDVLKQAFRDGADIHSITASQMFGKPVDEIDSELRRKAKTINFGIIYGISAHGLATRLGISRSEASEYIDAYFEQYPGIRAYMDRTKEIAHEQGYVETLFGRRIHLKDISSKNPNLRAFSERAAINAPLQGTAADIIKKAMVDVSRQLADRFPDTSMLLQVHDELVLEAPEAQADEVAELVRNTMQGAAFLSVPLIVESGIGRLWSEIH